MWAMMAIRSEEEKSKDEGLYTAGKYGPVCSCSSLFSKAADQQAISPDRCGLIENGTQEGISNKGWERLGKAEKS